MCRATISDKHIVGPFPERSKLGNEYFMEVADNRSTPNLDEGGEQENVARAFATLTMEKHGFHENGLCFAL